MSDHPDANEGRQRQDRHDAGDRNELLDVHLARYASFRQEIFERISMQSQAFNYLVVVLGAALAASAALVQANKPDLVPLLAALIPVLTAPLAYIYFDNELMILGIGGNIYTDLSNQVSGAIHSPVQLGVRALVYLEPFSRRAHRWLSYGRSLAFLIPSLGPTVFAISLIPQYWHDARFMMLVAGDSVVAVLLLAAVAAVYREHEKPGGFRSWGQPD